MLNDNIYSDLTARCGGRAEIGTACAGDEAVRALNSALPEGGRGGLRFVAGTDGCSAALLCSDCAEEEARSAAEALRVSGVPFVIVGGSPEALAAECGARYVKGDISALPPSAFDSAMRALLFSFPVRAIDVCIPDWVRSLPPENSAVAELCAAVRSVAPSLCTLADCEGLSGLLEDSSAWQSEVTLELLPAEGRARVGAKLKEGAFFKMLSETAGEDISDESSLMSFVVDAAAARKNYDKVRDALECARATGYGIVRPADDELCLEKPVIVRQGQNVGVKLKATAPSYHIVKVDVSGEVSPIMGSAAQAEAMAGDIIGGFESDPQSVWEANFFGRSLRDVVQDGLAGKVGGINEDTRVKLRKAMTRMVNEGKGGVICILL